MASGQMASGQMASGQIASGQSVKRTNENQANDKRANDKQANGNHANGKRANGKRANGKRALSQADSPVNSLPSSCRAAAKVAARQRTICVTWYLLDGPSVLMTTSMLPGSMVCH